MKSLIKLSLFAVCQSTCRTELQLTNRMVQPHLWASRLPAYNMEIHHSLWLLEERSIWIQSYLSSRSPTTLLCSSAPLTHMHVASQMSHPHLPPTHPRVAVPPIPGVLELCEQKQAGRGSRNRLITSYKLQFLSAIKDGNSRQESGGRNGSRGHEQNGSDNIMFILLTTSKGSAPCSAESMVVQGVI